MYYIHSPRLQLKCPYIHFCKRGYFLRENFAKMLARHFTWGNFHDTTPISFIKAYGFSRGVIFAKRTKARKTRKLPPRENFHVNSINHVAEYNFYLNKDETPGI